jgi:hypothetical protein
MVHRSPSARWAWLIESGRLDHEGELFAFVRHIMAEGLSKHEAYESLLRLSREASGKTPSPTHLIFHLIYSALH